MRKITWWLSRLAMRLRGDRGCKGEGFTFDRQGHAVPCFKRGCH